MKRSLYLVLSIIGSAWVLPSLGQSYRQSLDVQVPLQPTILKAGNKLTVYYELHITNFSGDTLLLHSLDIIDAKDSLNYLSLKGPALAGRFSLIGMKHADLKGTCLYPGHMAVVYIEVSGLKREASVFHQLQFSFTNENAGLIRTVQCCQTDFSAQEPVILANPLRGGPWCAIYNPSWETGHRRRIFTWDGKARIPGRYAIDFMKLNEEGQYADGNEDSITKWFGYNADVLAVSDGVIAATKDVFPESVTMSTHPKYPSDSATGNYISLKIGDHQYVFYEHLKPGSIRVKPGQYVRKGEVIGSLGYTGQTTGPHLHIHVAANNSPLGAEGIPFEFASFKSLGVYKDFDDFGKKPWTKQTMDKDQQRPVPFEVIQF